MIIDNLLSRLFVFVSDMHLALLAGISIFVVFYFLFRKRKIRNIIEGKKLRHYALSFFLY